jgi:hypothetical protein
VNNDGKLGYFGWSKGWTIANELEHAKVHLANKYCMRIGTVLKAELGDRYGDWEKLDNERVVPKHILL